MLFEINTQPVFEQHHSWLKLSYFSLVAFCCATVPFHVAFYDRISA